MKTQREHFGSGTAAVMAMAGSAIGLGNIWRFPYMVGENGGAAFIVVYMLSMVFISIPIFLCEAVIGRHTQMGTIGSVEKLGLGRGFKWMAALTVISPLIILSYYSVVGGWSVAFLVKGVVSGFGVGAGEYFGSFTSSVWGPLLCHTVFLLLTAGIVFGGVKSGIERFNKISLPALFVLIIAIATYSITLPGAGEGVRYLLVPDFSKLEGKTVLSAMGQSFFSLSLGVGTILTYASYMKKGDSILRTGAGTAVFDLLFALIAGFAVMPAVFASGIEPGSGPTLIYETLPHVFAGLSGSLPTVSRVVSIAFFLAIVVAALTSSVSMLEVGVAYLVEQRGMTRTKAVAVIVLSTWALGCLCSLSGRIFSACDHLVSNYLMTFGALLFTFIAGWKMKKSIVQDELACGPMFKVVYFMMRFIAPAMIVVIFVTNLII